MNWRKLWRKKVSEEMKEKMKGREEEEGNCMMRAGKFHVRKGREKLLKGIKSGSRKREERVSRKVK